MRVLCAIPCLDEEVAIGSVVLRAKRHADEVLVVDDGSSDRTAEVARMAGATVVRHDRNRGKGAAYQTLWAHAREKGFDALVVLDGDGQHDPDEIPLLLRALEAGNDLVIGARWGGKTQMPLWRKAGKRLLDYATAAGSRSKSGPRVTDSQSGFRAYSRRALEAIEPTHGGFSVESQTLIDAHAKGLRIGEAPIHCRYDVDGSTQGAVQHAGGVLNEVLIQVGIVHPLLFLGFPGFVATAIGVGMGAWAVYVWQTQAIFAPGWVLLGMTFILVGVLGIFAGLLFNVLPRALDKSFREHRGRP